MAPVKSRNRVVFDQGNRSNSVFLGSDIETEDPVSHVCGCQYCDAIAKKQSLCHDTDSGLGRGSGKAGVFELIIGTQLSFSEEWF